MMRMALTGVKHRVKINLVIYLAIVDLFKYLWLTICHVLCSTLSATDYVVAGTNRSDDGSGEFRMVARLVIHPNFTVGPYWLDAKGSTSRR